MECKDDLDYIYDNGNCNIKLLTSSDIINEVTVKIENSDSKIITELISSYISMLSTYVNDIPTENTIDLNEPILEEKKYSYDINTISEEAKKK